MEIAPIEYLVLPPLLDGSQGVYRRPLEEKRLEAETDIDAISIWLSMHENSPNAWRRYRAAVNQLVNWSLFELGKPVSSLEEDDFPKFCAFLRNPSPHAKWIGSRVHYGAPGWRPFRGPLSINSLNNTLVVLRPLIDFLSHKGYCRIWDSLIRTATRRSGGSLSTFNMAQPVVEPISQQYRQRLETILKVEEIDDAVQGRLILQLIYYCCLPPPALLKISMHDFGKEDGWPTLLFREKKQDRLIYLAPPIIHSIKLLRDSGALPDNIGYRQSEGEDRLFDMCYDVIKGHASRVLETLGSLDAQSTVKMRAQPTLSDIKRGGQLYANEHGKHMWQLIGYIPTFSKYIGAYLPSRKPLSYAEVSDLYQQLGFKSISEIS